MGAGMDSGRLRRRDVLRMGLSGLSLGVLTAACRPAPSAPASSSSSSSSAAAPTAQTAPAQATGATSAAPAAAATVQPAAAETARRGGLLRAVVQNDFVTMWPTVTTGPTADRCFDWLVRWRKGDDGRWGPTPGLAESWQLGDTSAVFKLRPGVTFHDGSPVNAEAVRWNVESWIKNPKSLARDNLGAVATDTPAEVVDDLTVKINLTAPFGSLLSAVSDATETTGITSKAAYEKLGEDGIKAQAVGSGPFIFDAWQAGSQLSVKRNPNYWEKASDGQPLPYLDQIVYRFVPDDSARLAELRSG